MAYLGCGGLVAPVTPTLRVLARCNGGIVGKVLVADDEKRVLDLLARFLVADGHEVTTAADGIEALEALAADDDIDLLLLDIAMPRCNGMQVLNAVSKQDNAPTVIVLSAVNEIAARVTMLDQGAADFISKPFHAGELLARVRRNLVRPPSPRRSGSDGAGRFLVAGGVTLDLERRRARFAEGDVSLSEKEVGLLSHLMRRRGSVCRRDELLHDVWGLDFDPGSNVVDVCMRRLRNKLGDPPIETVRGLGYCFDAD